MAGVGCGESVMVKFWSFIGIIFLGCYLQKCFFFFFFFFSVLGKTGRIKKAGVK